MDGPTMDNDRSWGAFMTKEESANHRNRLGLTKARLAGELTVTGMRFIGGNTCFKTGFFGPPGPNEGLGKE